MSISLGRKLFLILATSTGLTLTGCGAPEQHAQMYTGKLTDICLEDNNESNVDEVMSIEATVKVGIPSTTKATEEDLIKSLDKLELYTRRLIKLKEAGIKSPEESNGLFDFLDENIKAEELSKEQKEKIEAISLEDLDELLTVYKQHKQKDVEHARIEQQLEFLFENDQKWLQENGAFLLESGLMRIIKAQACTVSGLEPENYKDCVISGDNGRSKHILRVTDRKTAKTFEYKITKDSGVYYEALELLYNTQMGYVISTKGLASGFNIMKECAVTAPTVNEERVIVPTITKEEAIQKLKAYN